VYNLYWKRLDSADKEVRVICRLEQMWIREKPLTSMTGKERYTKLFSPELLDSSRLLMGAMRDMRVVYSSQL